MIWNDFQRAGYRQTLVDAAISSTLRQQKYLCVEVEGKKMWKRSKLKTLWAEPSFAMSGKESVGEYWYSQAENRSATSYTLCISMTPAPPAADAVSPVLWSTLGRRHPQDVYLCQHWLEDRKQPMEGDGFKTLIDTSPSFSSTAKKKPWLRRIAMSLPTIGLTRSSYLREQRVERDSNTLQISLRIPRISSFR